MRLLPAGTVSAFGSDVTIAMPVCQERVSPVLDTAARLLLVTRRRGQEVARREVVLSPLSPEALARCLAELQVDVLLCAALSESLARALERTRIRVRPHLCGEAQSVLRAFCTGQLHREEFRMPGCWGRHLGIECYPRRPATPARSARKKHSGAVPPDADRPSRTHL